MSDLGALRALASTSRWSRDVARQLLDGWQSHGGSLTEFARLLGCDYERLRRWTKRLEPASPVDDVAPSFLEVRPKPSARPLEVVAGEFIVRVPPDFDPATLRRLLTALEPC